MTVTDAPPTAHTDTFHTEAHCVGGVEGRAASATFRCPGHRPVTVTVVPDALAYHLVIDNAPAGSYDVKLHNSIVGHVDDHDGGPIDLCLDGHCCPLSLHAVTIEFTSPVDRTAERESA